MAPKEKKKTKRPNDVEKSLEPELVYEDIVDETDVLELNLYSDINDDFFNEANRVRIASLLRVLFSNFAPRLFNF